MTSNQTSHISKRNWLLIWGLGLIGQLCWNIEGAWFNNFVYAKIAKDPNIISWMIAISAIASTAATFIIGTWSDRIGRRKPFVVFGYICWGLFTILFGVSEFIPKEPYMAVVVFIIAVDAIMSFFGSTGYDGGFQPWSTDISNETNRGKLGGAFAAMPVLMSIVTVVVAGVIIDKLDYFPFFIIVGVIVMLAGIWTLFTMKDDPSLKPRKSNKGYWKQVGEVFTFSTVMGNKELFWVFVVNTVFFISFNIYFPYLTIYFNNYLGIDLTMSGIIQAVGLLAAITLTIPAAKQIQNGKMVHVILFSVCCSFVGLLFLAIFKALYGLTAGIFLAGIGYVLVLQTITAWIKNLFPEDQRGQFEGVRMLFAICIPMVIGPFISNIIIRKFGIYMEIDGVSGLVPTESLFIFSAFITLLTFIPLIAANRRVKERT